MRFLALTVALITVSAGVVIADDDVGEPTPITVEHRRVVLVGMPDTVFSATAAALGPWSIAVEATGEPTPASDEAAATMAQAHDASAVAWLDGDTLVIYDDLRRASERQPAQPAIDDVTAAALALSIKTALRRPVVIAPPDPPPPDPPPPDPPPPDPPPPDLPPPDLRPRQRRVRIAAHLGLGLPVRIGAQPLLHASARLSLDLRRAGLAVIAEAGIELLPSIDTAGFAGDFHDLVAGLGVEWRYPLRRGLTLTPSALLAVHLSRLDGTTAGDRKVGDDTTTAGLQLGLALDQEVGPLRLGGLMTAELLSSPVRYQVQGVDVLVVPRASLGWAVRISF